MLICDVGRFVFHHIPKTAGSSITAALAPFLRDPQPVTTGYGWHLRHHVRGLGMHATREEAWTRSSRCRPPEGYQEVSCVRNPYDLLVSGYCAGQKPGLDAAGNVKVEPVIPARMTFDQFLWEFLLSQKPTGKRRRALWFLRTTQTEFLRRPKGMKEEHLLVLHQEKLDIEWPTFCLGVGLPVLELPRINVSEGRKTYREYYSEWAIEKVTEYYHDDLVNYGYQF
jgi:hypothetical protein